MIIVD